MTHRIAQIIVTVCLLLASESIIKASNNNYPVGGRAVSMGNASVTFDNAFSAFHNQAGLGFIQNFSAGIAYRNNFFLQETGLKSLAIAAPISNVGVIGLSVNSFGFSAYGEHKFGLAFSKAFGEVISMGFQLDYLQTQFSEPYGSKGMILGEFGVLAKLNEKVRIGAHLFNPTRTTLEPSIPERIPTILKAGFSYTFSANLLTTLEIEKDLDLKPNLKAGLEYKINEKIYLRGGVNSAPVKVSFGAGFVFKNLQIDLASEYQQILGFVPAIGMRYSFDKQK